MKKLAIAVGLSLASASMLTSAQDTPPYENWVGGFINYYNADSEKPEPVGGLDDGRGFGGELGFRFDPAWAVRFELGRLLIDKDDNNPSALADDGTQIGVDAMYFLKDDVAYLFGGLREQSIRDSYRMASLGVGKHWKTNSNWRVITELATYYDFGQGYNEYSAKLGLAYVFGQSSAPSTRPDTDGDGVYDAIDRCPNSAPGTEIDATGCSIDLDGDGVPNNQDQCPTTPAGVKVDESGCEIVLKDSDGDGVYDDKDRCANTPTSDKVDAVGCSILEEEEVSVSLDILFPNNSSVISNPDSDKIEAFVAFMKRYPNTEAVIEGHTSTVGEAAYNQFLSEKRAQSVRSLLINEYGIDSSRLSAVGYGESRLKFTENTAEAHRLNRRIEVVVSTMIEKKVQR
ncbi:OmpA family protein [Agaribacter flavus]|uniref:OmpA family protein n=1 Tax=Agaribacter flavus TaxID=1902781 RepID=A0ABV7FTY8_9ALTE